MAVCHVWYETATMMLAMRSIPCNASSGRPLDQKYGCRREPCMAWALSFSDRSESLVRREAYPPISRVAVFMVMQQMY